MSWLPACRSLSGSQYPVIRNSAEEDQWSMEKCGILLFGGNNQQISYVRLFQHPLSFLPVSNSFIQRCHTQCATKMRKDIYAGCIFRSPTFTRRVRLFTKMTVVQMIHMTKAIDQCIHGS